MGKDEDIVGMPQLNTRRHCLDPGLCFSTNVAYTMQSQQHFPDFGNDENMALDDCGSTPTKNGIDIG